MPRPPKPWASARVPSMPISAPSTVNCTLPHAMPRPTLPSNSISSSFIMLRPLLLFISTLPCRHRCLGRASVRDVSLSPPALINRQHQYVALPICQHAQHSRLSSNRSQPNDEERKGGTIISIYTIMLFLHVSGAIA